GQVAFVVAVGVDVGFYVGRDPATRKWSYGGLLSGFLGGGGPIAASGGGFLQVTTASSVSNLKGVGAQTGGSIDVGVSIGGDYVGGVSPEGISYHGGQANFGYGVALFGAKIHHGFSGTAGWDSETGWKGSPPWTSASTPVSAPKGGVK